MMKKIFLFLLFFALGLNVVYSQNETIEDDDEIIALEELSFIPDSIANMISHTGTTDLVVDSISEVAHNLVEELTDSLYIRRLAAINSPIEFPFNSQVKSHIQLYTQRRKEQVSNMLGLSEYYFPMFEEVLDARNMPLELKYLSIIESALNTRALSRMGASGLWQFMLRTGRQYGLEVDSYIDERRDPEKATRAAADFLNDLYTRYDDWHLAIAAYNCGAGNVDKAIRRSGGKRDFWEIYSHLPRETRGYVPAFIAATYVMTYAEEHNLYPNPTSLPTVSDTIMINQPLHFEQIAAILQIPVETIRDLNPQYKRDVIPAKTKSYALKLSYDNSMLFASFEDSIYNHNRQKYFPDNRLVVNPSTTNYAVTPPDGRAAISYTVKSGDAVGLIADWFNVRTSDLRYWNNINGNLIRVGQRLTVYVPKNREEHYKAVAQSRSAKSSSANNQQTARTTAAQNVADDSNYEYYVVKSGDNLWTIAQKYPGVSNEDILRLNNITDARRIRPGQRLKIRRLS